MKITGIAISASSCDRSRTIRRRSLVAAVGRRARAAARGDASAQTAPASSQPAIPARRATAMASQIVARDRDGQRQQQPGCLPGSPPASAASGALTSMPGENSEHGPVARTSVASAAGVRITQVPSIQTVASDSAATSRSPVHIIRRRGPRARSGPPRAAPHRRAIEIATCSSIEMTIAIGQATAPRRQTRPPEISTGSRNSAPTGSVTASARPRAATSDGSDTGRASRNSFSGDPARTASAAGGAAPPGCRTRRVVDDQRQRRELPRHVDRLCAITANACLNSPTYASPIATPTTTANSVDRPRPRARNALRIERSR